MSCIQRELSCALQLCNVQLVRFDVFTCTAGSLMPYDPNRTFTCEGLEIMKENEKMIKHLKDRLDELINSFEAVFSQR